MRIIVKSAYKLKWVTNTVKSMHKHEPCVFCCDEVFYCEHRKRVIPVCFDDFQMPGWMSMLIGTSVFEVPRLSCCLHFVALLFGIVVATLRELSFPPTVGACSPLKIFDTPPSPPLHFSGHCSGFGHLGRFQKSPIN